VARGNYSYRRSRREVVKEVVLLLFP